MALNGSLAPFIEEGTIYLTNMENVKYLKKCSLSQQLVLETKTQQHSDKNKTREKKTNQEMKNKKKKKSNNKKQKDKNIVVTDDVSRCYTDPNASETECKASFKICLRGISIQHFSIWKLILILTLSLLITSFFCTI